MHDVEGDLDDFQGKVQVRTVGKRGAASWGASGDHWTRWRFRERGSNLTGMWLALEESHVLSRLSTEELDQYEASGEQSPSGKLSGIIDQVTSRVRGRVAACDANLIKMGPDGTIPSELLWAASTIARNSLAAVLPTRLGEDKIREDETRRAEKDLDDASSCKLRIAGPDGTIPETQVDSGGVYGGEPLMQF